MACRLVNLHTHPLRVDLRGGAVLVLAPGARSAALREELLYDNHHVVEWERAGWLRRLPARMSDVEADEVAAAMPAPTIEAKVPAAAAAKGKARASPAKKSPRRGASRKSGKR